MTAADRPQSQVVREGNRIQIRQHFGLAELHWLLAVMHTATEKLGYEDLILDFSSCTAAFAPPMLSVCAQVMALRERGTDCEFVPPTERHLSTLFRNTNWANLMDPARHEPSRFRGFTQVPATPFESASEQNDAVNQIVEVILGAMTGVGRDEFAAMEWAISEMTDNVLQHAECPFGGLVQVTTFQRQRRRVEFVVCDAGIGIPKSLRAGHPKITDDMQALDQAIREGVTRDKAVGMGNGLFGSYEVCRISGGYFQIQSGYATLYYDAKKGLHVKSEKVPFAGTLVLACIDCSVPGVLHEALMFGGKPHTHTDFIEHHYEMDHANAIRFVMRDEVQSFGSREAAKPVRNKLDNLAAMCESQIIVIDFAEVPLVSSSFADEVFGMLFEAMGPLLFMKRFDFVNISDTVRSLVDRAITQRGIG